MSTMFDIKEEIGDELEGKFEGVLWMVFNLLFDL